MFVGVVAPLRWSLAYMVQEYEGAAWAAYDAAVRRQAAGRQQVAVTGQ